MSSSNSVLSVKELNQLVKDLLTDGIGQIWLIGEISNLTKPASGHWYFSLKDELAQVRCAMFRNTNMRAGFIPQNGQQVLVRASVTLYEARGEYQLIVEQMQPAGAGLLQQKFDQLKQKLQNEGLFENHHKKLMPSNIKTVGVITSSTGAALHDICQILKRRDPNIHIIVYPTLVQGDEAAPKIAKMITLANQRAECDILIVGRGGGSLEDLWPFNEELVARAIFNSQLPIISAVGHEIDFTIADFVADIRAATPSAAAELISRNRLDQINDIKKLEQRLGMAIDYFIAKKRQQLQQCLHQLQTQHPQVKLTKQQNRLLVQNKALTAAIKQILFNHSNKINRLERYIYQYSPQYKIERYQQRVLTQKERLLSQIQQYLMLAKQKIAIQASQLNAISPLATLERGYSIMTDQKGQAIRSLKTVHIGQTIKIKMTEGHVTSTVTKIENYREE